MATRKKDKKRTVLVTGGAGFMGSHFVNHSVRKYPSEHFVVVDSLTAVADKKNISVWGAKNFTFVRCDIRNMRALEKIFKKFAPERVVHFAAETHVDVSIRHPQIFLETNVMGTFNLLTLAHAYKASRFLHISTDEVYGALPPKGRAFTESSPFNPNSPYSASKAGAEHIVRAFHETYGLDTVIARCTNNYGPGQDATKFIPVCITRALLGKQLPIYGKGLNVRDWIYVSDSTAAFDAVLRCGKSGEVYNIGAGVQMRNIDVARQILKQTGRDASLISYVHDRPGHDFRYALNTAKIRRELNWKPKVHFDEGLQKTVEWDKTRQTRGPKNR